MVAKVARPERKGYKLQSLGLVGLGCLSLLACGLCPPVRADILVMQDGSRIETDGPWQVEGRQVTFLQKSGTLSAVRLSEVDLEASEAANRETEAVAAAPEPKDKPKVEDVLVLTNRDFGLGPDGIVEPEGGDPELGVKPGGGVRVADWSYGAGGLGSVYQVTGTLVNEGTSEAREISLHLDIVAVDPVTQERQDSRHILRRATVERSVLAPGTSTTFTYLVTESDLGVHGAHGFDDPVVSFDVQFRKVEIEPDPAAERGGDNAAQSASGTPQSTAATPSEEGR